MALPAFVEPLSHGIYAIDTGFHRPRYDAAYLIVEGRHAAFVDTGTNHAVPRLLEALDALGLTRDNVDAVIPTHVHLDHAGGVGTLMAALPRATCWVHERGARHMVDPTALYEGALAVYGAEEMARSYGRLVPVPAERVQATHEGLTIRLGDRPLSFIDTPGHARHHHCVWDEASRGWFTGDTFGASYREFDTAAGAWIVPTIVPTQFEPEPLRASIARLLERAPQWIYLTHYGRVGDVPLLAAKMLAMLDRMVAVGVARRADPQRDAAIKRDLRATLLDSLRAHGVQRDDVSALVDIDVELGAQGLAGWLDRPAKAAARA